jgi:hypothetical protein
MAVEKVSLSLDATLVGEARRVAGPRGLSALVSDALRVRLQHERLRRVLAEMDAERGPVPEADMQRVRRVWPSPRNTGRRRPRRSA